MVQSKQDKRFRRLAPLSDGRDATVKITSRGGIATLMSFSAKDITDGYFERIVDDTSTASITLSHGVAVTTGYAKTDRMKRMVALCNAIGNIEKFINELEIWVDGTLQWAGPVVNVLFESGVTTIEARDNTFWWKGRSVRNILQPDRIDASEMVKVYHETSMAVDPITNFNLINSPSGVFTSSIITNRDQRNAFDLIDELADWAIDYTAVGRNVKVGGPEAFGILPDKIRDKDWASNSSPSIQSLSEGFATRLIATSDGIEGQVIVQADPKIVSSYGIIEKYINFDYIIEEQDLEEAALAHLNTLQNAIYIQRGSTITLAPGFPMNLLMLIPGYHVFVISSITCKQVSQLMRIQKTRFELRTGNTSVTLEPPALNPDGTKISNAELVDQ